MRAKMYAEMDMSRCSLFDLKQLKTTFHLSTMMAVSHEEKLAWKLYEHLA